MEVTVEKRKIIVRVGDRKFVYEEIYRESEIPCRYGFERLRIAYSCFYILACKEHYKLSHDIAKLYGCKPFCILPDVCLNAFLKKDIGLCYFCGRVSSHCLCHECVKEFSMKIYSCGLEDIVE